MFINTDALVSLQILGVESHPNYMNQGPDKSKSGAKESLSVYGIFHILTHTAQGKMKLRQMFLRPSIDLDLIHERQRTISIFLHPDNSTMITQICKILRRIKDVKSYLLRLKKGVNLAGTRGPIERSTWATLQAFSAYAIELHEVTRKLHGTSGLGIVSMVGDRQLTIHHLPDPDRHTGR